MQKEVDLTLVHAPTIYDFRERPGIWGPINDLVPSTPLFEMYPLGFASMMSYLGREGYDVKIVNIALKMLLDKKFDVEGYLKKLKTKAVGIDLHWLPHAHGSINLAKIFKKYQPETPVIFGGLSSSYFYQELMDTKEIDFVLRGDSCELPLLRLMENLDNGKYEEVPNLVYRKDGKVEVNPLSHVPEDLKDFAIDYSYYFKGIKNIRSLIDAAPYVDFLDKPIMAVIHCKGCQNNCPHCGGSKFAYKKICNREKVAFKTPKEIVDDIIAIASFKSPCFILGDLLLGGEKRAVETLQLIKKEGIDVPIIFEFFTPPRRGFIEEISKTVADFSIEISPESQDENIRKYGGRVYTNLELHKMIETALEKGCNKFDIYFLIGLGLQTRESVKSIADFCETLLKKHSEDGKVQPFLSPYAPFLDPGSLAFEFPEKYGYIKHCHSLASHFDRLDSAATWKDLLSYETQYLSRTDIVDLTYDSAIRLANIKETYGLITSKEKEEIIQRTELSMNLIKNVDELRANGMPATRIPMEVAEELNDRIFCSKGELNWSFVAMREVLKRVFFK